jgi:hypothetical protein
MPSPIRHAEGTRPWFARDAAPDRKPIAFMPVFGDWTQEKEDTLM